MASPFREAEFDIIYGEGVSKEGDLLDLGVAQSLVEKSGSWFSYKGDRIGQGRENARQFLKDNPDIRRTIDTDLRKTLGLIKPDGAPVAASWKPSAAKPAPARVASHANPGLPVYEEERQRAILLRRRACRLPRARRWPLPVRLRALDEALGGGFPGHMVELSTFAAAKPRSPSSAWRTPGPPHRRVDRCRTYSTRLRLTAGSRSGACPSPSLSIREQGLETRVRWRAPVWTDRWTRGRLVPRLELEAIGSDAPLCKAACWHQVCGSCVTAS